MSHGKTRTNTETEAIAGTRQQVISPVDGSVYAEFDLPSAAEIEAMET